VPDFSGMSFEELRRLRASLPDPMAQRFLAPYEHRAFAREYMRENPFKGLGLLAGIPGYQLAKGMGLMGSRTGFSDPLRQMGQGYLGVGEGLGALLKRM
jgi:hypothetical protein